MCSVTKINIVNYLLFVWCLCGVCVCVCVVCVCVVWVGAVFVLNHASPDDFQPFTLRDLHALIAKSFVSSKLQVASGVSLFSSGIVPTGCGFQQVKSYKKAEEINPPDINLHLLPSNLSLADSYGVHTTSRPEKQGY